ncbi:MAG: putative nucleic acid-binding Zn-ribbon protein [Maribacter sp.]|jgi:predicted  nucleic acid-binding Zn-ribbon protein
MAKKEYTVPEKLKQLFELQTVDSKLDGIKILKGELPMEVQDLEDEITGLRTRIGNLEGSVEGTQKDISKLENHIIDSKALIEKYEHQLNNVKNNREYEALTKELELQQLDIRLFEKRINENKGGVEVKQTTLTNAQERLEAKIKDLGLKMIELEKIKEKTEKDEEKLLRKSARARKKIEERLLKSYDKIRNNYRNGLSVVTVARDSCGGCFNQIPAQLQLEIQQRKKILACEHCGRVLVDDDIMMVGKEPKVVAPVEGAEAVEGAEEKK